MGKETTVSGRLLTADRLRNSINGNAVYRLAIERADGTGVLVADTKPDSMAGPDVDNLRLSYGDRVTVTLAPGGQIESIEEQSDDDDTCDEVLEDGTVCGESLADSEGWDGKCGNCADRIYAREVDNDD